MLTETTTLHDKYGRLTWVYVERQLDDPSKYIGTYPWEWIHPDDVPGVKTALGLALLGEDAGVCQYRLHPDKYPGEWLVDTRWLRVPASETPVIGISKTYSALVGSLTEQERFVARMLPYFKTQEIAEKMQISESGVRSLKMRLAAKIGVSAAKLVEFCNAHAQVL